MILVYFKGLGEWFIRDGHSVKLAITRTTKEPYRDLRQHKRIETYCPDYDEWLGLDEDNEENFAEWAQLYESTRNTGNTVLDDLYDFESKDYKYDSHLRGIFVRDPNVEGDVFDTDGLRCWGADYVCCDEIEGVFKLTPNAEKHFRLTNKDPKSDWDEFKKVIKQLLPCSHSDSVFVKMVNEGKLSNIDAERVYFEIKDQHHLDFFGKSTPIERQNTLDFISMNETQTEINNTSSVDLVPYKSDSKELTYTKTLLLSNIETDGIDLNTLAEVILGMSIDKYSHDPESPNNSVYKKIQESLFSVSISVEIEDIDKCLAHGFEVHIDKKTRNLKYSRDIKTTIEPSKFLRLIGGMAIVAYDWEPMKKGRQSVTGKKNTSSISVRLSKLQKYLIRVDSGTVRNYLNEVKKFLPISNQ